MAEVFTVALTVGNAILTREGFGGGVLRFLTTGGWEITAAAAATAAATAAAARCGATLFAVALDTEAVTLKPALGARCIRTFASVDFWINGYAS